jgi:hypothetical protein
MLWQLACVLEVDIGYFFAGLSRELGGSDSFRRRRAEPRAIESSGAAERADAA